MIRFRLEDPDSRGRSVLLHYRAGGRGAFARLELAPSATVATIPAGVGRTGTVEYLFEGQD